MAGHMELERTEAELTRDVPTILDRMNQASDSINKLEGKIAQTEMELLNLGQICCYEDLRARHGNIIDRTRPYFEAMAKLQSMMKRAKNKAELHSAAVLAHANAVTKLRHMESQPTVEVDDVCVAKMRSWVTRCEGHCNSLEEESESSKCQLQEAQKHVENTKKMVGETAVWRAAPCFLALQQQQEKLDRVHRKLKLLTEKASLCKEIYSKAISDLERISSAVHTARGADTTAR